MSYYLMDAEEGLASKAEFGVGKEGIAGVQAALTAPACNSSFPSALPLLKPFESATDTSILDLPGVVPDLVDSFLPSTGQLTV